MEGKLFNIQKFSIHDGPGVRTTVFFKGCNLRCRWCHNPESISRDNQIEFYPEKCIGCGACFPACPNGVHFLDENSVKNTLYFSHPDLKQYPKRFGSATGAGEHKLDRLKCTGCLLCAETCYANALVGVGLNVDVS